MKRVLIIIFILLFLFSPLAVFAQAEPTAPPADTQVYIIPFYVFVTQEGGALAITPVAENQYLYAYATSAEKVETGLINPTGTATAEDTSTELGNQPVIPMGLLLVAVGSDPDAVNSFLETGEGVGQRIFTGKELDDDSGLTYFGARYYAGVLGKFLTEDPIFINTGDLSSLKIWREGLTNPQRLNSYSYSRNNPLTYFDPLGLWDSKTGTVEKGDTLTSITSQINSLYSTSYSIFDVSKLNSISNPDKINVGQIIKPNAKTPDVTNELNTLNKEHAQYAQQKNYGDIRFGLKEMPHGDWDLKSQKGTFCQESRCGGQQFESYIYDAQEIQGDAPGNIHYGYVGHAIGKSLEELLNRASQAQAFSDIFSLKWPSGDRPNDTPNITWGFNLYK